MKIFSAACLPSRRRPPLSGLFTVAWLVLFGSLHLFPLRFPFCGSVAQAQVPQRSAAADDTDFLPFGIYQQTAPRPEPTAAVPTRLPLELKPDARVALIGNTLLEREQHFGYFETMLQQAHAGTQIVIRNLAWPADTPELQPRPANFADLHQHLRYERIDIVIAAFGFNESFDGPEGIAAFKASLTRFVQTTQANAYNGQHGPQIVLLSPIPNENVAGIAAADRNNRNIALYAEAIRTVAKQQQVGFVDLFTPLQPALAAVENDLTFNGVHLTEPGYRLLGQTLFQGLFGQSVESSVNDQIRETVIDKNRQYQRRYRPVNTFYYTGDRRKSYGYLDFLPAMRNFEILAANRDRRIWDLAADKRVPPTIDDSNAPPLPQAQASRGANQWMTAADEQAAFQVDPRFEVNLFAGEEQFPDLAAPIQMRWDSQGRLWVSCSTTYPHVYPGNEPNDKIVILEDTDGDGRADKSSVFADNLHIPLSFEFGDGGLYVSEQPHLTFLKDTDGDGRADLRRRVLTGFGTEDSHHSLHDFTWTPDGDLLFRDSIFLHSQIETPYGPVRQQNSGWYRFEPRKHRLTSFGTYPSTNPWGVTFDDWGRHMASHPIFAAAFHALDPPYPLQHPRPDGLQAYSGTCGQEFVDFATFPESMRGNFLKARYKPTNRIEIHRWVESEYGFDEEYVTDLIFAKNLSFIPVDMRFGPRGALYICDWYNPIKGHAQYSLRDDRRDRHSGRIWRVVAKDHPLQQPPKIAGAPIDDLLEILKRPEYRYRYWVKRELREREPQRVRAALDRWVATLDRTDPRYRHHQTEALWTYRNIDAVNLDLLRELLSCENHHARAAATQQLRYWHQAMPDATQWLRKSVNDPKGLVRMEAAIAASYIGSGEAFNTLLEIFRHPHDKHLTYAIRTAFGSKTLRPFWAEDPNSVVALKLKQAQRQSALKEPKARGAEATFDKQPDVRRLTISCVPEQMLFTVQQFSVTAGQPVKLVFMNPDATDHNLVLLQPGALAEVGMAANEMAKDPKNAEGDFIPASKRELILHASPLIGPTRKTQVHVLRFQAPTEPGLYPYVCTFPGHWVVMNGVMAVGRDSRHAAELLAASQPKIVQAWKIADFKDLKIESTEASVTRGMQAFVKASCNQCHVVAGHGVNLGPDLSTTVKQYNDHELLKQILEPSAKVHEKYQTHQFVLDDGRVLAGLIASEDAQYYNVITNLLNPQAVERLAKDSVEAKVASQVSSMPSGLLDVLRREEILDMLAFLRAGDYELPAHLKKMHSHHHGEENASE